MRKYLTLLFIVLLPFLNSCEKHDTYGTLEIEVVADAQRTFRIEIYPYCIDASVKNLPVYSSVWLDTGCKRYWWERDKDRILQVRLTYGLFCNVSRKIAQ